MYDPLQTKVLYFIMLFHRCKFLSVLFCFALFIVFFVFQIRWHCPALSQSTYQKHKGLFSMRNRQLLCHQWICCLLHLQILPDKNIKKNNTWCNYCLGTMFYYFKNKRKIKRPDACFRLKLLHWQGRIYHLFF